MTSSKSLFHLDRRILGHLHIVKPASVLSVRDLFFNTWNCISVITVQSYVSRVLGAKRLCRPKWTFARVILFMYEIGYSNWNKLDSNHWKQFSAKCTPSFNFWQDSKAYWDDRGPNTEELTKTNKHTNIQTNIRQNAFIQSDILCFSFECDTGWMSNPKGSSFHSSLLCRVLSSAIIPAIMPKLVMVEIQKCLLFFYKNGFVSYKSGQHYL